MDIKKKMLEDGSVKEIYDLLASNFPLVANGTIEIKAIAYEKGVRVLIAIFSNDSSVSPVGELMDIEILEKIEKEIGGSKISLILWKDDPKSLIEDAMDSLFVSDIVLDEKNHTAKVKIDSNNMYYYEDGVILKLAKELTGWNIEILN